MSGTQAKKKTTKKLRLFRKGKKRMRLGPKRSNVGKIRDRMGTLITISGPSQNTTTSETS